MNNDHVKKVTESLISQIEEMIQKEGILPWESPYFKMLLNQFHNPFRCGKDSSQHQVEQKDPFFYSGLFNNFSLFLAMNGVFARTGHRDPRFVPMSSVKSQSNYNFLYKKGVRVNIPWDEINQIQDDQEKKKRIYQEYSARTVTIIYPIIKNNPEFDPSQPEGPSNSKKKFVGWGTGQVVNVADTNLIGSNGKAPLLDRKGERILSDLVTEKRENPQISDLECIFKFPCDIVWDECIPHYHLQEKKIHCPERNRFKSSLGFYMTMIHELMHQIGDMLHDIKEISEPYGKEELNAEIATSVFMAHKGFIDVNSAELRNSAAYCTNWLDKLKKDPMILLDAANEASKRVAILLSGTISAERVKYPEKFSYLPVEAEV